MFRYQRPVGAKADCKEIEFISAIHQAVPNPRKDGSITAYDVSHFLLSRYGIEVTEEEARKTIIKGYGGGEGQEECIDIAELTATLLIPYLLKESRCIPSPLDTARGKTNVIGNVISMILGDATGAPTPTTIDHGLIRSILITYGEAELAQDNELVHGMFLAATDGHDGVQLNEQSFAKAITGDIQHYDVETESAPTSNYFDVFPMKEERVHRGAIASPVDEESPGLQHEIDLPKEVPNAAGIDYISDTHRSKLFAVLLWAFFIMTQYTYFPDLVFLDNVGACEDDFLCFISGGIVRWIIITFYYSVGGTMFVAVGSLGNNYSSDSVWPAIGSIFAMVAATFTPFVLVAKRGQNEDTSLMYSFVITLTLGIIVIMLEIIYMLGQSACFQQVINHRGIKNMFSFLHEGNILLESYAKIAAVHKTRLMVMNAIELHRPISDIEFSRQKSYKLALLDYGKKGESYEMCGGLIWTWLNFISWKLSQKEGLLIPSKLITANILQLVMSIFLLMFLIVVTQQTGKAAARTIEEYEVFADSLSSLPRAIIASGYVGATAGFIACLVLTSNYLPAVVKTTLQLRSGVISSLDDDKFSKYMSAPDYVSKVPGSMFWAIFFSGGATFLFIAPIVFVFAFENTRRFAFTLTSQAVGILIPSIIQILIMMWLRNKFYAGHYRTEPVSANFLGLAFQCLDYGLASGYMWARAIKLILFSIYYIGRVDTPLFTPEVGTFGEYDIDDTPTHFRKLIIAHEAHRHPFIEVLGKMYLLKLRYREEFGRTPGSRWRMIFVSALMPWMRRHRVVNENLSSRGGSLNVTPRESFIDVIADEEWAEERVQVQNTSDIVATFLSESTTSTGDKSDSALNTVGEADVTIRPTVVIGV